MGKRDKNLGKLERELLIKVNLPPLDKYNLFQVAKRHYIVSIIPSQIDFALNDALTGDPGTYMGRGDTLQPRILAIPPISSTMPAGTNYDLAMLILNLEIASKHKERQQK
jgi:hypothetical protein